MADEIPPILIPNYNEGYPSPFLFHAESLSFTTDNEWLPSVWNSQINEGYPCFAGWPNITNAKVQTYPFPKILPAFIAGYNEDYPVINEIDMTNAKVQVKPFPRILPDLEHPEKLDGYPSFGWNDGLDDFGAFARSNITKIKIPESVKFIQDFTFYDTSVKKVKIAADCVYFEHSFPEECEIEFYE